MPCLLLMLYSAEQAGLEVVLDWRQDWSTHGDGDGDGEEQLVDYGRESYSEEKKRSGWMTDSGT